jgi:dienelactone hydrolase
VLPGASGWRPEYVEIAERFAEAGFTALAVNYYAETGGASIGSEEKLQRWESWRRTVQAAVVYLERMPSVAAGRIGLVGYSRGAFLAVSTAGSIPGVKAVIDFYGGGGGGTLPLKREVRGLPPILIVHGERDSVVPVSFAQELRNAVLEAGGAVEMHLLPGTDHAFNLPWSSTYSRESDETSLALALEFLRLRLGREAAPAHKKSGSGSGRLRRPPTQPA